MEPVQELTSTERDRPGDLREALGAGAEGTEGLRFDYRQHCERCVVLRDSVPALPYGGGYGEAAELIFYYFINNSKRLRF